ncbi:hypothetical protein Aca07nite_87890 [Actinoplanes capillaceus]|uniref:NodB homology domain-containing protein n=1 Tax=Actinoplanes campanulatus TaxID=113559 RepID=A0ABQ3WYZ6_9ACTN|nr:polysaccharide deacetylase family protein [Actinoplanes capillaceus]GID51514.1 hypothetical protein Aca07nite_87890 [Actinoplanes capillaceus]
MAAHTVIAVNYHRVGDVDPANPLHRLHTVPTEVFRAQLHHMQQLGPIVSLDAVRECRDLAELNFVVTFDDVPTAAMTGIEWMLDRQLPATVAVCTGLASAGWGERDKVYCIERFANPDRVQAAVRAVFPDVVGDDPISFYRFTKREDLDPDKVATALIDPLFAEVENRARPFLSGGGYLPWSQIHKLADNPLVTIANHTTTHVNLVPLSFDRLRKEIETAHDQITGQLSAALRYLAIPFGHLRQRLALDCLDVVTPLHYDGILWVGHAATLVTAPYRAQPLHLTRMHAPTSVDDFVHRIQTMAEQAVPTAIWTLPQCTHREPVTVIESSDPVPVTRFEMLARQGKDYASDPGFYRYQFTENPAKGNRPDYYAVDQNGRIEATAYNVHARFRIGEVTVPGVYLGSWRKLPNAHPSAAGTLVQRMTTREAVVGVYLPSSIAAPAFTHWHPIPVRRLTIAVTPTADTARLERALELDTFDDTVSPLADALMRATDFTLLRDRRFYRWRHESYPLADCRYIVLARRTDRLAYAVTLQRGDRVEIADWYAPSAAGYAQLVVAVQDNARDHGARTIEVETSDRALADHLAARHAAEVRQGTNFYHFNRGRLADAGIPGTTVDDLLERWPDLRFHETASTGDLLLR